MIPCMGNAQILPTRDQKLLSDSIRNELEFGPYFGLYKDCYFTVGTKQIDHLSRQNGDVKFQISLGIRLTPPSLPGNSYLFLSYTQKTIWNVFQESMPMRDINFNPGIGWAIPFFNKGRYAGRLVIMAEHESNGRDGEESRSWNKLSFSGSTMIDEWLMVHAKYWIPIIDSGYNRDICRYSGLFQGGFVVKTPNQRWTFGLTWVKRQGWNLNFNTIGEISWKVSPKTNLNLFMQYYNGYGENLLDYKQFRNALRVGMVFKPKFFSEF